MTLLVRVWALIPKQFLMFALVGAAGTAVQYAFLWLGVNGFQLSAPTASAIGFAAGSVVNYLLNYAITFASAASHLHAATRYYVIVAVGFALNWALMGAFVHGLRWNYWLAQIVTTGLCLCWNYLGSKRWAFRHRPGGGSVDPRT